MRGLRVMAALGLVALIAGCGDGDGDGDKTTTILPGPSPPAQTETTGTEPTGTTPAPLPGGRAAVDGTYLMKVRSTSYEGQNLVSGVLEGDESKWPIATVCEQQACRLDVRRELDSGAYENFTLSEVKDRSYAASSTGKTRCLTGEDNVPTRQRLSIRLSGIAEADGRPVAQRLDAYLTVSATCDNHPARGVISWRGTRQP